MIPSPNDRFSFCHQTSVAPHFAAIVNLRRRTGNHEIIDVPLHSRLHNLPASVMTVAIRDASFAPHAVCLVMHRARSIFVLRFRIHVWIYLQRKKKSISSTFFTTPPTTATNVGHAKNNEQKQTTRTNSTKNEQFGFGLE